MKIINAADKCPKKEVFNQKMKIFKQIMKQEALFFAYSVDKNLY